MMSDWHIQKIELAIHTELHRSFNQHGGWSDLNYAGMFAVVLDELTEVLKALNNGDYYGQHGAYNELAQVAACCQKMILNIMLREKQNDTQTT